MIKFIQIQEKYTCDDCEFGCITKVKSKNVNNKLQDINTELNRGYLLLLL